jgi:hypothetical protein
MIIFILLKKINLNYKINTLIPPDPSKIEAPRQFYFIFFIYLEEPQQIVSSFTEV